MKCIKFLLIAGFSLFAHLGLQAQTLPVGMPVVDDYYRRAQLLSEVDTNLSLTVRPIFPDSINGSIGPVRSDGIKLPFSFLGNKQLWQSDDHKLQLYLLPVTVLTQYNTHHPYGWNDGPMIPAKGFQTYVTGGLFAKYGILSMQFKPEVVFAANPAFDTFNDNQFPVIAARYYDIYNNIDLPVRFGSESYTRIYPGQSSIRLNYKKFSLGISTENLWWGPGVRNSLVMSNTAPGFPHLTLNTTTPVNTIIGSFEGQLIGGWLTNSEFPPLIPNRFYFGTNLYVPKPDKSRYISGVIVTWQPKWVPGLFLGVNQTQQSYTDNVSGVKDYLPWFLPFKNAGGPNEPISKRDRLSTAFMRWLWTKEHAEFYFEFGYYNSNPAVAQSFLATNVSRGYTFGLRRMVPFNKLRNENILIGLEVTQLQENSIANLKNGIQWYVSKGIRQGYTNSGQMLGAGIGPGANMQSLSVSWVKGLNSLGFTLERYIHNNDFVYYAFYDAQDYSRHWVDIGGGLTGQWAYKNILFNTKAWVINSLDYQWYVKDNHNDIFYKNGVNVYNFQLQLGATYRF